MECRARKSCERSTIVASGADADTTPFNTPGSGAIPKSVSRQSSAVIGKRTSAQSAPKFPCCSWQHDSATIRPSNILIMSRSEHRARSAWREARGWGVFAATTVRVKFFNHGVVPNVPRARRRGSPFSPLGQNQPRGLEENRMPAEHAVDRIRRLGQRCRENAKGDAALVEVDVREQILDVHLARETLAEKRDVRPEPGRDQAVSAMAGWPPPTKISERLLW